MRYQMTVLNTQELKITQFLFDFTTQTKQRRTNKEDKTMRNKSHIYH